MRIDMTSGQPLRKMLAFSAPMLVGGILMQLSDLLDGMIVGRVAGVGAFAGIAAAMPVAFLAVGFLMGVCSGFLIPVAQAVGAGDRDAADRYACAAILYTVVLSLLIALPAAALSGWLIKLTGTPPDIAPDARVYLRITLLGMPVSLLCMMLSGILRAEGDAKTPMLCHALGMALRLALDGLLIIWLRMGVVGAALAALISDGATCALLAGYLLRVHPGITKRARSVVNGDLVRKLFLLGVPIGATSLLASLGSAAFQRAVNALGSTAVAAVAVSDRLQMLILVPAMMLGGVAEVFAAQNFGARRMDRVRTGARQLYALMVAVLLPITLLVAAGGRLFVPLMLGGASPQLIGLAQRYMLFCALFLPMRCVGVVWRNALQGIGQPGRALIASCYDLLIRVACALFGVAQFGLAAIILTNPIAWVLSALALMVSWRAVSADAVRPGGI